VKRGKIIIGPLCGKGVTMVAPRLLKSFQILKKATKQQPAQMLPDNPEVADWVRKNPPRDDMQMWFVRNYRKDPKIFNETNKTALAYFVSMFGHVPALNQFRSTSDHTFDAGLAEMQRIESEHAGSQDEWILASGNKIIDLGGDWGWYDLEKGSCPDEANAMGHCGNEPSERTGDTILSLRREKQVGDKLYHRPSLIFVENRGPLVEMKGRGNDKPADHYHGAIVRLLQHPRIKQLIGGGYKPETNFSIFDLTDEDRQAVLAKNPKLKFNSTPHDRLYGRRSVITSVEAQALMNDEDGAVRLACVDSLYLKPEHTERAMNDEDWYVHQAAQERLASLKKARLL
jgi:hypothetical protein